ncbi:hypothetical protein [Streptacidiphilus sp. PAMC 29251]
MPAPTAHLRSGAEMAALLTRYPGTLEATTAPGRSCVLDLDDLRPELPGFPVPEDHSEASWLHHLAEQGCTQRYGDRSDPKARPAWIQLGHELNVIERMDMCGYFLIVHDITRFAARQNIWCQGRGSAASSVVCYVLGITAVEPLACGLLFERFLSLEKAGPRVPCQVCMLWFGVRLTTQPESTG